MRFRGLWGVLLGSLLISTPAFAPNFHCPGTWINNYCVCPNGEITANWDYNAGYLCSNECPNGTSYCSVDNLCCNQGFYCSKYGCTPHGATDCGTGYCKPGQKCASGNTCIESDADDCGNGQHCGPGLKCAGGNKCIADAGYCGPNCHCRPGYKASWFIRGCIPENNIDCGHGYSCGAGLICAGKRGEAKCITPEEAAKRGANAAKVNIEREYNRTVVKIYVGELAALPLEVTQALLQPNKYIIEATVGKWAESAGILPPIDPSLPVQYRIIAPEIPAPIEFLIRPGVAE